MATMPSQGVKRKLSSGSQASTLDDQTPKAKTSLASECGSDSKHSPSTTIQPHMTITDLPKELIVQIVGHALINPSPITLRKPNSLKDNSASRDTKRKRTRKSPLLGILLVCRDFYFAGLEAYYGGNTFHFDTPVHLRDTFVTTLSERHKACVKHLIVDWGSWIKEYSRHPGKEVMYCSPWELKVPEDLLKDFPELESVVVSCSMLVDEYWSGDAVAKAVQERVLQVWPSNASKIEFVFPSSWGTLADGAMS